MRAATASHEATVLQYTASGFLELQAIRDAAAPDEVLAIGCAAEVGGPVLTHYVFEGQVVSPYSCVASPAAVRRAARALAERPDLVPVLIVHTHPRLPAYFSRPDEVLAQVMGAMFWGSTIRRRIVGRRRQKVEIATAYSYAMVLNDRDEKYAEITLRCFCPDCGSDATSPEPRRVDVRILAPSPDEPGVDVPRVQAEVRARLVRSSLGPSPAFGAAGADDSEFRPSDLASLKRELGALRTRLLDVLRVPGHVELDDPVLELLARLEQLRDAVDANGPTTRQKERKTSLRRNHERAR